MARSLSAQAGIVVVSFIMAAWIASAQAQPVAIELSNADLPVASATSPESPEAPPNAVTAVNAPPRTATEEGPVRQATDIARLILEAARKHRVGADLIAAVAAAESRFDPRALSPKGAQGIMQLMPATARRFGVRDVWSAQDNIDGGAAYLRWLLDFFSGDTTLAVAAYNAGEQAVLRAGRRIPPFEETRRYVPKVLAWKAHYARTLDALDSSR